jgi:hypothetical protein
MVGAVGIKARSVRFENESLSLAVDIDSDYDAACPVAPMAPKWKLMHGLDPDLARTATSKRASLQFRKQDALWMIHKISDSRRLGRTQLGRESNGLISRVDDSHLLLPPRWFDNGTDEAVLSFLNEAAGRLAAPHIPHDEVGNVLRHIYAVLHLRRRELTHAGWRAFVETCRRHPILTLLHEDALTYRAWAKPRGYAGDAVLLDYMYGSEHVWKLPDMSELGRRLHAWTTCSSACQGVKSRRGIIAEFIDRLACDIRQPHILSMAAGHLREAEISAAVIRRQTGRVVAVDSDALSLDEVARDYGKFGVEPVQATAREILCGRVDLQGFDLIYSSGLCDYLNDSMSQRLAAELFDRLNPGGTLLLTNFVNDIEGVGYMEVFMDWNLVYRDRIAMMEMTARIPDRAIGHIAVFAEENQNVLFLAVQRAA